jgi:anti-sigma-K factor RskA
MENHVVELLPSFALGILDEKETESVLEHLGSCSVCRAELTSYEGVTQYLGLAAPMVEPPPDLKQKVLRRISASSDLALDKRTRQTASTRRSLLKSFLFSWQPFVALLVLALFSSNLLLWRQVSQLRAAPTPVNFGLIKMVGTDPSANASGLLVVSPDGKDGSLVVAGLKQLDKTHEYQLWLTKDGQRTSGGVFSVSDDGYGSLWVYSEQPLNSYSQFGVTIEPTGGSPGPTGVKVLGGEL